MRFRVQCANPDTAEEYDWEIDCPTIQEAEQRAVASGILVSTVTPMANAQILET